MREVTHEHSFTYGDVPGLGECACNAYRVFNRETQAYEIHEGDE